MNPPSDYRQIVDAGAAVLRTLGAQLRERASAEPDVPELWLSVRDYESLAGRLSEVDDFEWQNGFGTFLVAGQDFGVIDGLLAHEAGPVRLSDHQAAALSRLRRFLDQYERGGSS